MTTVTIEVAEERAVADNDLTHMVWDHTPDKALCGADVSGHPWAESLVGEPPLCLRCKAIEAKWRAMEEAAT